MLRKLLIIFLWIVFIVFLAGDIFFAIMGAYNHYLDSKCMNSKTIVNIKSGQNGEYEVTVPEILSHFNVMYVNSAELIPQEMDYLKQYGLEGKWVLKDTNGKEIFKDNLLFNSYWKRYGKNSPARYLFFDPLPKSPGKLIVKVKATGEKPVISSDCQLVFQPFLEFGPMVTMFAIAICAGASIIVFISGLILYVMIRTDKNQKTRTKSVITGSDGSL